MPFYIWRKNIVNLTGEQCWGTVNTGKISGGTVEFFLNITQADTWLNRSHVKFQKTRVGLVNKSHMQMQNFHIRMHCADSDFANYCMLWISFGELVVLPGYKKYIPFPFFLGILSKFFGCFKWTTNFLSFTSFFLVFVFLFFSSFEMDKIVVPKPEIIFWSY